MIIFKQQVSADTGYTATNQPNCVVFDVHNDTPYNMGISFGRDTGVDNADYYTGPHSILTGIKPLSNAPSINMVKWSGIIYIWTETPLGTGNTNLATAPAFQITVIGYPTGYQPQGTVSMSRMTATPNAVNTVGGTSSAIQNDANTAGTSIVEATVSGDSASAVSWTNNAILVNGDAAHPGTVSLDNAKITTDGSGNITSISFSGVWRSATAGQGLSNALNSVAAHISTYNANAIFPQSGATSTGLVLITRDGAGTAQTGLSINPAATECEIWENTYINGTIDVNGSATLDGGSITTDGSGNVSLAGIINGALYIDTGATPGSSNIRLGTSAANAGNLLDNPAGTNQALYIKNPNAGTGALIYQAPNGTTRWSLGAMNTGTAASGTINHGLGNTPAAVLCVCDSTSSSATVGAYSYTSTQFGMTIGGGLNGRWWAYR